MMKSRISSNGASAAPSLEALLREKDARIAELTADKEQLYHLLAEAQASLAREQALRSQPPAPAQPIGVQGLEAALAEVVPEAQREAAAGAMLFKFANEEPRAEAELSAMTPAEAAGGMELFQFAPVRSASGSKAPPETGQAAAETPIAARKSPPLLGSSEQCPDDKKKPLWRRLGGKGVQG